MNPKLRANYWIDFDSTHLDTDPEMFVACLAGMSTSLTNQLHFLAEHLEQHSEDMSLAYVVEGAMHLSAVTQVMIEKLNGGMDTTGEAPLVIFPSTDTHVVIQEENTDEVKVVPLNELTVEVLPGSFHPVSLTELRSERVREAGLRHGDKGAYQAIGVYEKFGEPVNGTVIDFAAQR